MAWSFEPEKWVFIGSGFPANGEIFCVGYICIFSISYFVRGTLRLYVYRYVCKYIDVFFNFIKSSSG